jgi:hypothetical protein
MSRYVSILALLIITGTAAAQQFSTGPQAVNPPFNPAPDVFTYQHDDGTVETGVGITDPAGGTHDIIWLNRFTVSGGNNIITNIQAAYGSPSDTRPYNGIPVTLVLYNDPDGGSTQNASLVYSQNVVVTNGNTGIINNYAIPPTAVQNFFLVGVLASNLPTGLNNTDPNARFLASFDQTDPDIAGVSFAGFTDPGNTLNPANLAGIPAGQYGTIEGFGLPGNWVVRAVGDVPEPTSLALFGLAGLLAIRRR